MQQRISYKSFATKIETHVHPAGKETLTNLSPLLLATGPYRTPIKYYHICYYHRLLSRSQTPLPFSTPGFPFSTFNSTIRFVPSGGLLTTNPACPNSPLVFNPFGHGS